MYYVHVISVQSSYDTIVEVLRSELEQKRRCSENNHSAAEALSCSGSDLSRDQLDDPWKWLP